jgi:uncharacterized protein
VPISMYEASVPVCLQFLTALSAILDKAAEHARTQGVDAAELVEARLAPDMFPLSRQIQIATDHAKGMAARLSGREAPKYPDDETTIEALKARIAKTMEFISSVEVAEIDGSAEREVTITIGGQPRTMVGQRYLMHFALPNFFFHTTTAYAILRNRGVALGKKDFMGGLPG